MKHGNRSIQLRGRRVTLGPGYQLPPLALDAALVAPSTAGQPEPAATWVQIGYEGEWKGHVRGPFELTRALFEKTIVNFRALPQYRPGAQNAPAEQILAGAYFCIPWDFHHASEQPPTDGTIPISGAPAQGWAMELEIRNGPDGKAQLWAFTRFLEPLRQYIRDLKYRWCSMTLYPDATDPVSGESIGPYLSSVAATNDPFLQGMVPLTASRRGDGGKVQAMYWDDWNAPTTREQAIEWLRKQFNLLESAGVKEINDELAKFAAWATGAQPTPDGVDVEEVVGCLRRLVNLPLYSTAEEVFAGVAKLVVEPPKAAPNAQPATPAEPAPAEPAEPTTASRDKPPAQPPGNPGTVPDGKDPLMDPKLLAQIAALLSVPATPAEVEKALLAQLQRGKNALTTLDRLAKRFGLRLESDNAVEEVGTKTNDALAGLEAILAALEVENPSDASKKIADMFKKCAELEKVMPELSSLREMKTKAEDAAIENEVDAAMQAHKVPASMRKSLILHRKSDPADFAKTYPIPEKERAYLTSRMFAGNEGGAGAQGAGGGTSLAKGNGGGPAVPPPAPGEGRGVDLSQYAGNNVTERALTYLAQKNGEGWNRIPYNEKFRMARQVVAESTAQRPGAAGANA